MITAPSRSYATVNNRIVRLVIVGIIGTLAIFVWPDPGSAQQPRTITFDEAVHIALDQNTDILRSENEVRVQGARLRRERMRFAPDLRLSTSGTRSFGRSFSQEEGEILNETSDFFGIGADVTVNLFDGFEKIGSTQRAALNEEASSLRLQRTREDVVFQVIDHFTQLLQDRQLAQVREQELEAQQQLLGQVRGLVEVGRQPKSDLFQQQAAVAEARVALEQVRRRVELDQSRLIQVLELDPMNDYRFEAEELSDSVQGDPSEHDLGRILETAYRSRNDLEALETRVVAAEQGVQVARSGYWPSLSLSFGYGSDWSSTASRLGGDGRSDFFDQLDARRGGSIRLSLSLPIFDRFQTRTNVQEAEMQLQNAQYDLQDQRQQVALQVRQAVLDYRSAHAELNAAEERLEAARQAREAALRRYELGGATFVEVAQATSDFVSAQSGRIRARYTVLHARKLIEHYSGILNTEMPRFP